MKAKKNSLGLDTLWALFHDDTLSVHIIQGKPIVRKQWYPWNWTLQESDTIRNKKDFLHVLDNLEEHISSAEDAYKEINRKHSHVWQIWMYRIVLVLPPVSPVIEMTIVRPLVSLSLPDYNLPKSITHMLQKPWHGVLIAWSPWEWKTTFAQALLQSLDQHRYIIKTLEAPRDVQVWWHVTQYGLAHTTHNEIRDILLLTRPDITLFDEVRNKEDFLLYKDMRLAGIGLIWVMHATSAIDAIQRSIGIIEMWMIAQVVDTIIFIQWWSIQEVLTLRQEVKVPVGMNSVDLARPVLIVSSELSKKPVYEIYTYSDNVVVMPLQWAQSSANKSVIYEYAAHALEKQLQSILRTSVRVEVTWIQSITLYVSARESGRVIGKGWKNIMQLQEDLGVSIDLKTFDEYKK